MLPNIEKCQYSTSVSTCIRQFSHLLLLLLKLKAWRLIFIIVPITLMMSNLYVLPWQVSLLSGTGAGEDKRQLVFYGARDFAASQVKVLIDRSDEVAVSSLISASGGQGNWIEDCRKEADCREKLIHQFDASIVAHMRYSSKSEQSRNVLDCLNEENSHLMCAFLYQLMVQSIYSRAQNETMKNVQLFEMHNTEQSEMFQEDQFNNRSDLSLPNSICTDWINSGVLPRLTEYGTTFIVALAAIGVTFYLLVSTISCIHMLKSEGFLQHQFQGGMSVTAYWLVVWLFTITECLAFAAVFIVSHTMQCPGLYSVAAIVQMSVFLALFSLNLAAFMLLLETLLPSMLVVSMLAIQLNVGLVLAFSFNEYLVTKAPYVLYMFPPMFAKDYIAKRMNSEIEQRRTGLSIPDDEAGRFSNIIAANLVSLLFQMLLLTYFDFLLKAGNGLCLPLSYPLTSEFWFPRRVEYEGKATSAESEPHIEPVMGLPTAVVIKDVSKTYINCCSCYPDEAPFVLKELSCTIYRGQITALIGHNGAGKTTLIKILAGEELPDAGTAHIGGCLVTNPLLRLALRGRIGICPQFDILCDSLTVMECIRVTLVSRAVSDTSQLERAREMLQRLGLGDKEDVLSCDLSGGQKRKVSTILALLGDPDVVFLDEPTSGLDPVSRRQLWQLLQEEKRARSIILCTQFMDEADILADRKIFLCGGKIVCAGSSMFLKRAFGCSFTLNVSLKSKDVAQSLLAKLKQVRVKSHDDTELQLEVPALNSDVLTEAVQVLESSGEVETFGLSQASLDDVFMRLSGMDSEDVIKAFREGTLMLPEFSSAANVSSEFSELRISNKMRTSVVVQFASLFIVNIKRQVRVRSNLIGRFLVPAALLAIVALFSTTLKITGKVMLNDPEMSQMDILVEPQGLRIGLLGKEEIPIVCVFENGTNPISMEDCKDLTLRDTDQNSEPQPPYLVRKSPSQSMQDFMSQRSFRDQLYYKVVEDNLNYGRRPLTPCVVYHASSWTRNASNKDRILTISLLSGTRNSKQDVHIRRRALIKMLKFFGTMGPEATTALALLQDFEKADIKMAILTILLCFSFSLFPVSYLSDPVEDMTSRVRSYLVSTGMTHLAYWINTFAMHWLQYVICYIIAVGLIMISEAYRCAFLILVAFLPVFILGIVSNLLTIYTIAVLTKTKSTLVSIGCIMGAVLFPFAVHFVEKYPLYFTLMIWLVPPIAPVSLLYSSSKTYFYKLEYYQTVDALELTSMAASVWKDAGIFHSLLAMPVHIIVLCSIICVVEQSAAVRDAVCRRGALTKLDTPDGDVEDGARKEAERVLAAPRNSKNVLEVRQLHKSYSNGVHAVRGITYGAMAGEIFGLLGANGAGKSTSMSVIVGEEAATEGVCEVRVQDDAWVSGREGAAVGAIGYCPQHNPLFNSITVAEHIRFYADIRGLDMIDADQQTTRLVKSLGLEPHRDKQAGQLSGGNKRRLCLAIAMLGDPALIVIDEASTGVDPENKRFIWGAIRRMMRKQRSVMVTTHSMEEVEALCTRVGIMNRGRMISVGTVQQLRSCHGDAYTLELLLSPEAESALRQKRLSIQKAVADQFKGAQTQEDLGLGLVVQFSVPKSAVQSLSEALKWLAANQSRLGVSYWALYQMSLDQVFVKLVKMYDEPVQKSAGKTRSNS